MSFQHQEAVAVAAEMEPLLRDALGKNALACYPVIAGDKSGMHIEIEVDSLEDTCAVRDTLNNTPGFEGYESDVRFRVVGKEQMPGGDPLFSEHRITAVTEATAAAFSINNL